MRNNVSSIASLLGSAIRGEREDLAFTLDGDLRQMAAQEQFLQSHGIRVGRTDVYPGVYTDEDKLRALKLIWENRVEGWWNYRRQFVEFQICTEAEFDAAFK
jgi:hypothetical protein